MAQPPEPDWIEKRLVGARPQAVAALLRYFRDLDLAEEAFQDACLRALKSWPRNGPPRDAASWLIMVGHNAAIDHKRRQARLTALPDEALISDREDTEPDMAERLDAADYRDDILRLLFVCCHPDLPATQQIALALRIVSGLSVPRIASAFLVAERAMEQRITRAKARIANAEIPFETPGPKERAERFAVVSAMLYLVFNEGYIDANPASERARLCGEAIRLARLMLRLFPCEPEILGLMALMLLQHSRQRARFDETGAPILLEDQDRSLWNQRRIAEALAMIDEAMLYRQPGPYQIQAAIAAQHARAERPEDTDWVGIDRLYEALERHAPSPVVTLNRSVAVWKLFGAEAALEMIAPLAEPLDGYFYFHGVRGNLLERLGRNSEARDALGRAIALANTAAEAAHIRQHLDQLNAEQANDAS
ncbi:sigma-70 family RNA polymerase sigma factor [bacterium]|nr:sigma-70 family RNA polymerase sigma factor [bacterium]